VPSEPRSDVPAPIDPPLPDGTRRWIDAVLVVAGIVAAVEGLPVVGVPLLLVGALLPFLHWRARRAGGIEHLLRLVPAEVARAHQAVVVAAARPGVVEPAHVVAAADELVLEVAAVLGGRAPRRASQRRFVSVRVAALESVAADLGERHEAWRAAIRELDELVPHEDHRAEIDDASGPGWLSVCLLVALAPAFLLVDLVRGTGRVVLALVEGIALRLRTVLDLVVAGARAMASAVAAARRGWRAFTAGVRDAARTARGRFVAARALAMRRLRRARTVARRPS
jgi:hypothetical protein